MKIAAVFLFILFITSCTQKQIKENEYLISPKPFTEVKVTDNFWANRIKTNHDVTIPIAIQKSRETGRIKNFEIAGGLAEGEFCSPYPFDDSDIYKIIEGAAYSLQMFPDPEMEATVDSLVDLIELAQEDDGYLYTNRTIMGENGHEWIGKERWVNVDKLSHELYNLGHFYEAAVAYYQATGKKKILDIAIKSADLVDREFGYGKIENYPGHQEIEIGLVKLYRITGEKRYLDLAKFFLDIRGKGELGEKTTYNQSHLPVVEQTEAVGHSVRGAYMWTGMADVAALTGDQAYVNAISKIWEDVVYKKLYITGGIGAAGGYEGFGGPYELPNMRAYCETCAAIANVFWNYRMFLMSGDAKYIDVLERSLYNNVLSGVSLSGDHFFYPNPLESFGQHQRSQWFGCACCPSNISRFIPSMPNYIYAQDHSSIYINLFVSSSTSFDINGKSFDIKQKSNMPWDGKIIIEVNPYEIVSADLKIRIPGWASDSPVPGNLYSFMSEPSKNPLITVNGKEVSLKTEKGYVTISRKWKKKDKVEILFPLEVRKIKANPNIEDDVDKMALQMGPLVYCAEWADYEDPDILSMYVDPESGIITSYEAEKLDGIMTLSADGFGTRQTENGLETYPRKFKAIPYYAWAHRGKGQMMVWIPVKKEATRPKPAPTIANTSKVEASHESSGLFGISDGILPKNSADESNIFYHWWPDENVTHWIVYNFQKPEVVSSSGIYWFVDVPNGGCDLPADWKILYKSGNSWLPVKIKGNYGIEKDKLNNVEFDPVKTSALKLEVKLPENNSSGIHEWTVE
ncbi:MAG: glycoside hydrolase family 127 protein [Prolixibacteraceae bacterium]|nr:glycoside hydrolase family 127 protein [Prolixibacteraceae bacterium]